jgi:steroid delta-isomerase-like uncharacterized protein
VAQDWLERWVSAWEGHVAAGGPGGADASDRILALFSPEGVWEDVAADASYRGHGALREMFIASYEWCPNLTFTPVSVQAEGSRYAIEWRMSGRGGAAFGDLPSHDHPFSVRGVSVGEVDADRKVIRHSDYWNLLDWMTQCGHLAGASA